MSDFIFSSAAPPDSLSQLHDDEDVEEEEVHREDASVCDEELQVSGQVEVLPDAWTSTRRELGYEGVWTISTAKPGDRQRERRADLWLVLTCF